jgi:hypothetical protein
MSPVVKIKDLELEIERRKASLGVPGDDYVLPNSGANRTNEKRELLRLIQIAAARNGRKPTLTANIQPD